MSFSRQKTEIRSADEKGSVRDEVLTLNPAWSTVSALLSLTTTKLIIIRNLKKLMETLYDYTSEPFSGDEFVGWQSVISSSM